MRPHFAPVLATVIATVLTMPAAAQAPRGGMDPNLVNRLADAEFNRGQVMQTAAYLTDRIGGRMTNSPAMRQAEDWTAGQFRAWGLKNVRKDAFDFGRGWSIEKATVRLVSPRVQTLRSIPVAWTPATKGPLAGEIVVAPLRRERDFDAWRGKLRGRIVLVSFPAPPKDETDPRFRRLADADFARYGGFEQPSVNLLNADTRALERGQFARKLDDFLKAEGAIGWVRMSYRADGRVSGEGAGFQVGRTPALPGAELTQEDYRKLARLAKVGPVRIEIDHDVRYDDRDRNGYNILADIPGRDPAAGYVMAGAHLDSWVGADGATDNAAGSAVVMEAARLIASLGIMPRRTIRFALWSGEEQGLIGSWSYVDKYVAKRPPNPNRELAALGAYRGAPTFPISPLPGFKDLVAYFNLDNGSGKIRGVFTEGNFAVAPIFREWLGPLAAMGATQVTARSTGSTDHVFMSRLGIPAFQFIQDPLDYGSITHHSDVDTYDHLRAEDLRQASVMMAAFLLAAAERDEPLPRNATPTQPVDSDPFRYEEPEGN